SGEKRRHRQQANYLGEQLAAYFAKRGRHITHLSGIHSGNPHCRRDTVNELQVHTAAPWSIGADQEFSLPTP
ncbi:MAG: hypothetical protein V4470_15645, partial [Pseudomonadota bacterium]